LFKSNDKSDEHALVKVLFHGQFRFGEVNIISSSSGLRLVLKHNESLI